MSKNSSRTIDLQRTRKCRSEDLSIPIFLKRVQYKVQLLPIRPSDPLVLLVLFEENRTMTSFLAGGTIRSFLRRLYPTTHPIKSSSKIFENQGLWASVACVSAVTAASSLFADAAEAEILGRHPTGVESAPASAATGTSTTSSMTEPASGVASTPPPPASLDMPRTTPVAASPGHGVFGGTKVLLPQVQSRDDLPTYTLKEFRDGGADGKIWVALDGGEIHAKRSMRHISYFFFGASSFLCVYVCLPVCLSACLPVCLSDFVCFCLCVSASDSVSSFCFCFCFSTRCV